MNTLAPDYFADAAELLVRERRASVALLQRQFRLGHSSAWLLMKRLADAGVVEDPNPKGRYRVAYRLIPYQLPQPPAAAVQARILHDLALYLMEYHGREDEACIALLTGSHSANRLMLHGIVRDVLADRPSNPLLSTVLALAALPQIGQHFPTDEVFEALGEAVAGSVADLERDENPALILHAALLHAMRYLQRCILAGTQPAPDAIHTFVHGALAHGGRVAESGDIQIDGEQAGEAIQRKASEMLRHGIPLDEVANWVEPFVRVS